MKNIIIKFFGLGYDNINQAHVLIYDKNNCKIVDKNTYNNIVNVCLKENQIYHIIAKSKYETIDTYFYVNNNTTYCFKYNNSILQRKNNIITFLLTDYYYDNLPIERGNLLLWQNQ